MWGNHNVEDLFWEGFEIEIFRFNSPISVIRYMGTIIALQISVRELGGDNDVPGMGVFRYECLDTALKFLMNPEAHIRFRYTGIHS